MPRVMISYRNIEGQKQFASALEKDLRNAGIETWSDFSDIPPVSKREDENFKGVINSDYVVLCLSPEYFESETCLVECYVARGYGKTLLPIIAPHDSAENVYELFQNYEATRGLEHINFLNYKTQSVLGLVEDNTKLTQRLIKSIKNPTLLDVNYDVYFSFKSSQANFATDIADNLNEVGIKSFIHTRLLDPGVDWRRVSWSAGLRTKIHIVILSPDIADSEYIRSEVQITRTKKETKYIPILAKEFVNDEKVKSAIRQTLATSRYLSELNDIQWIIPKEEYQVFMDELITDIQELLARNAL